MKVSEGDFVCVPRGSRHAILEGVVLAEVQQNSNATYRVYDWGREDANRPLHVDKAMDVINIGQVEPCIQSPSTITIEEGVEREALCKNRYFSVERMKMACGLH